MTDLPLYAQPVSKAVLEYGHAKQGRNIYRLSKYNAKYYDEHKEQIAARRKRNYYTAKAKHIQERVTSMIADSQNILMPTSRVFITLPDCSGYEIMQDMENALKAQYVHDFRITFLTDKRGPWSVAIKV